MPSSPAERRRSGCDGVVVCAPPNRRMRWHRVRRSGCILWREEPCGEGRFSPRAGLGRSAELQVRCDSSTRVVDGRGRRCQIGWLLGGGVSLGGVPEGPALSQADAPSTVPEGGPGDAPERGRVLQVRRWKELALSKWGENLGEAARLLESSQVSRRRRPRRAGAIAGRKPEGRSEAHGGMAARTGRRDGRHGGLREEEAQEGSGLRRQANSRSDVPDSGYGKPRGRACGVRGRFRPPHAAVKCTAGGQPTSWR